MIDSAGIHFQRIQPSEADDDDLMMPAIDRRLTADALHNAAKSGAPASRNPDRLAASDGRLANFCRGATSTLRLLLAPLGRRAAGFHCQLSSAARLRQGLVIVLPGIDGCTTVSDNVARGIIAADCPSAVEIHDWRSFRGWNPLHLATARRNREQARNICGRIVDYRSQYPDRPVHLVGHSAGAGIALLTLSELPAGVHVDTTVLLAAAVSREFDVDSVARATSGGVWNFWSRGDLPTLGLGTMIFGTVDRRHSASAGALGFASHRMPSSLDGESNLHQIGYQYAMVRCWNFGGHFGCTNTAFVKRYVAPILTGQVESAGALLRSG